MSTEASVFPFTSPRDGSALPPVRATAASDLDAIVAGAHAAQALWAARTLEARIEAMQAFKGRLLDRGTELARLISLETGKPEVEALLAEVLASADVVEAWCKHVGPWLEDEPVALDATAYPKKEAWITRVPRGVVAVIMPWNYPLALPLRTIVPALLAGNAVVFKPSEVTPRVGAVIGECFQGLLPDGLFATVQGGRDVGAGLVAARVDLVAFTGSVAAGRKVSVACAERFVPCSLELGGKDAAIVRADADLDRAASGIAWGAFTNAGQNCAAIERVYVHEAVAKPFLDKLVATVKSLTPRADMGTLTTEAQLAIVRRHCEEAVAKGAEVLTGGAAEGLYFTPTVLRVTNDDCAAVREESFGPLLPVMVVASDEEAIAKANDCRYGLTGSIWTRDERAAERMAAKLRTGVVTVNNHSFTGAIPLLPWTGVGETGTGVTNSHFALDHLTRPRAVLVDRNKAPRELWWMPYGAALEVIARALLELRRPGAGVGAKLSAVVALLTNLPKRWKGLPLPKA
jgi:acyl-CoA reductase-like NAD-dependent aldehyde dehydrogenase